MLVDVEIIEVLLLGANHVVQYLDEKLKFHLPHVLLGTKIKVIFAPEVVKLLLHLLSFVVLFVVTLVVLTKCA